MAACLTCAAATASGQAEGGESHDAVVFELSSKAKDALADRQLRASVRLALTAQFAGLGVRVEFAQQSTTLASLRARLRAAQTKAEEVDALGVFWLDATSAEDWLLYLFAPKGDRVLVRRVPVGQSGPAAATEAVAVIAHSATRALQLGQQPGMEPVPEAQARAPRTDSEPRPAAEPPVAVRRLPRRRSIRVQSDHTPTLAVARHSHHYASGGWVKGWQLAVGAELYRWLYVGLQYTAVGSVGAERNWGGDPAWTRIAVNRHPLAVFGGVRHALGPLSLGADLGLGVEFVTRLTQDVAEGTMATPDKSRAVWSITPRVRVGVRPFSNFEFYSAGSLAWIPNNFGFWTASLPAKPGDPPGNPHQLLAPRAVRPTLEFGVVWLPLGS